ncbi:hypothetical protein MetexDRAFT_1383 [Methylorubrum extorquens DSM 13060]|uniref:Uncharacterized protein n=1 Tax=Methylorubrum extorquens DSM 13060 TaxID=882800 RepID=H1KFH1_METEX|nr:hypothetical protein MetexDRAFT_1383 [Methylorubrum extorquens DSM 13060]BDL42392.1 hypothetical protein MSPGM_49820 [Methylorubrum sp. GM97]
MFRSPGARPPPSLSRGGLPAPCAIAREQKRSWAAFHASVSPFLPPADKIGIPAPSQSDGCAYRARSSLSVNAFGTPRVADFGQSAGLLFLNHLARTRARPIEIEPVRGLGTVPRLSVSLDCPCPSVKCLQRKPAGRSPRLIASERQSGTDRSGRQAPYRAEQGRRRDHRDVRRGHDKPIVQRPAVLAFAACHSWQLGVIAAEGADDPSVRNGTPAPRDAKNFSIRRSLSRRVTATKYTPVIVFACPTTAKA